MQLQYNINNDGFIYGSIYDGLDSLISIPTS